MPPPISTGVETLMEHGVVLTYPFKVAVPFEELVE